jgi:hypothetical protein
MKTIREARLRQEAADRYPFMPVRLWANAARIVELVRKHLERGRVRLSDSDFHFRGGTDHPAGVQTRMTDLARS